MTIRMSLLTLLMTRLLLSCTLIFHISIFAQYTHSVIKSISTWSEIEKYIDTEKITYLFTDLDDTLMRPTGHVGSTKWFVEKWTEYKTMGHAEHAALECAIKDLGDAYENITFRLMEPGLCALLKRIKGKNVIVHGLTARSLHLSDITHKHCNQVGLCFDDVAHEHTLTGSCPAGHMKGIIFCGNNTKGNIARQIILHKDNKEDIDVIFIDDSKKHVDSVITELSNLVGKVTGIHYSPAQE